MRLFTRSQAFLSRATPAAVASSLHPKEMQTATYLGYRNQFSKLAVEELAHRGLHIGKLAVQKQDRAEAQALLMEVIPKVRHLPFRSLRDLLLMANATSLHSECVSLFHAKWEEVSIDKDSWFVPHDAVVDSAFALGDVDELLCLAKLASTRLEKFSREVSCDFVIWRIVWRLACLCVHADDAHNPKKRDEAERAALHIWDHHIKAFHPALFNTILEHTLPYEGSDVAVASSSSVEAATPIITKPTAPPPLVHMVLDLEQGSTLRKGFPGIFRRIQRIVRYHRVPRGAKIDAAALHPLTVDASLGAVDTSDSTATSVSSGGERVAALPDNGEMKFFLFCRQHRLLRFQPEKILDAPPTDDTPPVNAGNVEQYFFALVGTCRRGLYVEQAIEYAEEFRSLLERHRQQTAATVSVKRTMKSGEALLLPNAPGEAQEGDALLPRPSAVAQEENKASQQQNQDDNNYEQHGDTMAESFVFHVLSVLQGARAHKLTLQFTRPIVQGTSQLSPALWSQILLAAGEERQLAICRQGFDYAVQSLQSSLANRHQSSPMEYLLQTSMHAMAKCHVPHLYETVIRPCVDEWKLITLTDETVAYLMTQNALHAPDAPAEVHNAREWMRENGVPLSTRIGSLMMKAMLRSESADIVPLYKELLAAQSASSNIRGGKKGPPSHEFLLPSNPSGVTFKRIWLEELILSADRRRYSLTHEERTFIIAEVERVFGKLRIDPDTGKFSTGALEGLRTQVAMLFHDAAHDPLASFHRWEEERALGSLHLKPAPGGDQPPSPAVESPPIPAPYLSDPRCYFLTRRPNCCTRYVEEGPWRRLAASFMNTPTSSSVPPLEALDIVSSKRARREVAEQCMSGMLLADPTGTQSEQLQGKLHEDGYRALLSSILEKSQRGASIGDSAWEGGSP